MTETFKLLKRFAATCLILLCLTAAFGAATVVHSNSRLLTFGEAGQQVAFSMNSQVITFETNEEARVLPRLSPWLRWARHAPAPLGTWFMLAYAIG